MNNIIKDWVLFLLLLAGILLCSGTAFLGGVYFGIEADFAKEKVINELEFIDILGQKFAENHNYSLDEYNCVNYSMDFMFVANSLGYNVSLTAGVKNETSETGHMWNNLNIELEPQSNKWGYLSKQYYLMRDKEYFFSKYGVKQ